MEILVNPDSFNKELLSNINILKEPYKRPFYLSNCHVETIFAAFYRSLPKLTYERECLKMPDGGTVAVDWPINGEDEEVWRGQLEEDVPVLILLVRAFFIILLPAVLIPQNVKFRLVCIHRPLKESQRRVF